jgi:ribosomal protein S18 acetylase RimI-like enzyme
MTLARSARLSHADRLAFCDENLVESSREFTRRVPGAAIHEEDGLLFFASIDAASSGLIRTGAAVPPPPEETIARANAFFAARGLRFSIITRAHADADLEAAAETAGFHLAADRPGMVLDGPVPSLDPCPGADLRRVVDARGRAGFVDVIAEVYDGFADVGRAIFSDPCSLLDTPHAAGFSVCVGGAPVSIAMVNLMSGVGGVDWVATRPAFRGRRHGEVVTRASANAAFDMGARIVALQSEPLAEPVYARAGFETITRYRWYESPAVDRG